MAYGIQRKISSLYMPTLMLIGLVVLMIGRVLVVEPSSLEIGWFHGIARSKIQSPYPLLKLNTLLLQHVSLKRYG